MFTEIVKHQLNGQPLAIPCLADKRNSIIPINATLARTLAADTHQDTSGRTKFTTPAGKRATDPIRQILPKSPQ